MENARQYQPRRNVDLPDASDVGIVYPSSFIENETTIDELRSAFGTTKPAPYSLLRTLTATDLAERSGATHANQDQPPDGGDLRP